MKILNKILSEKIFKPSEKIRDFSIKLYEDFDYDSLINLFEKVFPGYISKKLWFWKNRKNPFGDSLIFLIKDKDKVISHYNIIPKDFYIYGVQIPCVQSLDTMTDSDYRGLGLFPYLGKLAYEYSKRKNFNFVYGFPNKVIHKIREIKLGWKNFGKIDLLLKIITPNIRSLKPNLKFSIKEISTFDKEINDFWEMYKDIFPLIIKKDMSYLNWRFVEHPFIKYKKFLIIENATNKIVAFFVLKRYKDKEGNISGHIVDFLIGPQNKDLKKNIFKLIESYSLNDIKEDCSKISFWMPDEDLKELALKKLGYNLTQIETYFGYKIFKYSRQLDILKLWKNWNITMANSDIF